jgi:hypothetical protein
VRLLAEAHCEHVIDMLADVAPPAFADPDERRKLAYLLTWPSVSADERAEQSPSPAAAAPDDLLVWYSVVRQGIMGP